MPPSPADTHSIYHRILLALPKLLIAFAAFAFCVILAEAGLRMLWPQPLAGVMFAHDSALGFWNRANLDGKPFQTELGSPPYHVSTDAAGYRTLSPIHTDRPDDLYRILILGDSYTFGVGVDDAETYPAQLESILKAVGIPNGIEVVNAACPGWGTENQLAFWRQRGASLNPDLLIVAFYRNDLLDNLRHFVYRAEGGMLVFAPQEGLARAKRLTRWIPFYDTLSEKSHLLNLMRRAMARIILSPPSQPDGTDPEREETGHTTQTLPAVLPQPESVVRPDALVMYRLLMETLLDEALQVGVPVMLLLIPGRTDCADPESTGFNVIAALAGEWMDAGLLRDVVDLRPAFVQSMAEDRDLLYIPNDGHFTPAGNRLAAREIAKAVLALLQNPDDDLFLLPE